MSVECLFSIWLCPASVLCGFCALVCCSSALCDNWKSLGRQILVQPSKGDGKGKFGGESVCGPQFLIVTYEPALFCVWVVVFHVSVMTLLAVSHLCDMNYGFFVICVWGCGVRVCVCGCSCMSGSECR